MEHEHEILTAKGTSATAAPPGAPEQEACSGLSAPKALPKSGGTATLETVPSPPPSAPKPQKHSQQQKGVPGNKMHHPGTAAPHALTGHVAQVSVGDGSAQLEGGGQHLGAGVCTARAPLPQPSGCSALNTPAEGCWLVSREIRAVTYGRAPGAKASPLPAQLPGAAGRPWAGHQAHARSLVQPDPALAMGQSPPHPAPRHGTGTSHPLLGPDFVGLLLRGLCGEQEAPPGLRHPAAPRRAQPSKLRAPKQPRAPCPHRGAAPGPPRAGYLRVGNVGAAITLKDEMTFLG